MKTAVDGKFSNSQYKVHVNFQYFHYLFNYALKPLLGKAFVSKSTYSIVCN